MFLSRVMFMNIIINSIIDYSSRGGGGDLAYLYIIIPIL